MEPFRLKMCFYQSVWQKQYRQILYANTAAEYILLRAMDT